MTQTPVFGDVLDAADRLSTDDQQELIEILKRRLAEAGRRRVVEEVRQARAEFAAGQCKPSTVDEIMGEIES